MLQRDALPVCKYNVGNITFSSRIAFHPFNLQGSHFTWETIIERDKQYLTSFQKYVIVNLEKEVISNSFKGREVIKIYSIIILKYSCFTLEVKLKLSIIISLNIKLN